MTSSIPGPKGQRLLGSLNDFKANPLRFFLSIHAQYGDTVAFRLAGTKVVLATHPDDIERVLKTNRKAYSKRTRGILTLREILGEGLLTQIDKDVWLGQRRLAQPTFRPKRIHTFAEAIAQQTQRTIDGWGETIMAGPEVAHLTLRIAGRCFFDAEPEAEETVAAAFLEVMAINRDRFAQAIPFPLWVPTPSNRRFARAMGILHGQIDQWIDERKDSAAERHDILSTLMAARDKETDARMSREILRDEAVTLLGAGHETTANALAFVLRHLSREPDIYQRVREEALAAWSGPIPTMDEVKELKYTSACIEEAMRINPPGWLFGRLAEEDDTLGGYRVPAGTLVMTSAFVTHRRNDFWVDPLIFRPERFMEAVKRHPFQYFPFSGGPRNCIGSHFAMLEMRIIIAMIARRFRSISAAAEGTPDWIPLVTLRPHDDVPLRLVPA